MLVFFGGCTLYEVREIDASKARGFDWNGRIRVTQARVPRRSLLDSRPPRTEVHRLELLSDTGLNVVIRPNEHRRGEAPYACTQAVGSPPDQFLVPAAKQVPEYQRLLKTMQVPVPEFEIDEEAWKEAWEEYARVDGHIRRREFEQVNGAQLAFSCAARLKQRETSYHLDDNTIVRVDITDGSLLTVVVEDAAGNVLRRYEPQELTVVGPE
jgi:hypothetical protein